MSTLIERVGATIVRNIVPREALLSSELGKWYERSESHRYNAGDVLVLRANSLGFGVRPVAVVKEYRSDNIRGSFYQVTMYADRMEEQGSSLRVRGPKDEALGQYVGRKATWGSIPQ